MRGLVGFVVACGGCNAAFDLKPTVAVDAAAGGGVHCDPLPFDPLRYHVPPIANAAVPLAKTVCAFSGSELVSFDLDDAAELTNELAGAPFPFWTSLSHASGEWTNSDNCLPALPWRMGQPATETATSCGLITNTSMVSAECGTTDYGGPVSVLCETPRPSAACIAKAGQRMHRLTAMTQANFVAAGAMCRFNEHLVEIDSSDELAAVNTVAGGLLPYWVGSQYQGAAWTTPTGCPAVYPWAANEPAAILGTGTNTCAQIDAGGLHVVNCSAGPTASVICEMNP